jgi:hypothetical protein
MPRPRLSAALTWPRYEAAVQTVLAEALRRLAALARLPAGEEPTNLELHWIAIKSRQELLRAGTITIPFGIYFDGRNQPEPDDTSNAENLRKRPDFLCMIVDEQAVDDRLSQIKYFWECKRLGQPARGRVFNDLYSQEGISRFRARTHCYAKGCPSACIVGYMQTMQPDQILNEVNGYARPRAFPDIARVDAAWAVRGATRLSQPPFSREFDPADVSLHHFWVDLRQSTFDLTADDLPQSAAPPAPPARRKRVAATRTSTWVRKKPSRASVKKPAKKK